MPGSWAFWMMGHAMFVQWAVERWEGVPGFGVQDAYKFLFQATLGGEHAIQNEEAARKWLDAEWASLGEPFASEPLIENLRPDGSVVRLNLRPFKKAGGAKERLFAAFVESAREFRSEKRSFELAWRLFGNRLKAGAVCGITWDEWESLDGNARAAGYPAIHHSEEYERMNWPAYRVLSGKAARGLVLQLSAIRTQGAGSDEALDRSLWPLGYDLLTCCTERAPGR